MTSETAAPEQDVIEDLRRTFEAQGLPFYSNPGEDIIPDFLRGTTRMALSSTRMVAGLSLKSRIGAATRPTANWRRSRSEWPNIKVGNSERFSSIPNFPS